MGVKTTVEIADPLFERAKRESEKSGCTLRDLIKLGLARELERREQAKPFKLRDASVNGEPIPEMRWDARSQKAYFRLMGAPGYPDTIEGINKLLDAGILDGDDS